MLRSNSGSRSVRDSIDPTGTMGMRPDAMKAAVGKIGEMFPAEGGAQLSGPERSLYDTVSNWGDLIPVERAFQMRANINGRIRGLQGSDPQEALRLGVLKNGVDDALAQAVAHVDVGERAGLIHEGLPGVGERVADVAPKIGLTVYTASGRPMDVRYELADLGAPNAPLFHTISRARQIRLSAGIAASGSFACGERGTGSASWQGSYSPNGSGLLSRRARVRRSSAPITWSRAETVECWRLGMLMKQRLPTADRYRAFLEQQGYDTTGMHQPVLVRRSDQ